MDYDIQLVQQKRMFSKTVKGSVSTVPDFTAFKDLPQLDTLQLGGRKASGSTLTVEVTAESGVFSTTYKVLANFGGTVPLSNKPGGRLSGFAEVSQHSVHYFNVDGESAGVVNRHRLPYEKASGISSAIGDEYCLGIQGSLSAVMEMISSVPLFRATALHVLKAVAAEMGDIKTVKA